jgi:hypothetical protein
VTTHARSRWACQAGARPYVWLALSLMVAVTAAILTEGTGTGRAAPPGTVHYPDLFNVIPPGDFQIAVVSGQRELRYTHNIFNGGDGPLEIRPVFDSATGTAQGFQRLFTHDSAGNWSLVSETQIAGVFTWHPEHGHYHFPLAQFGLYAVNPDNSVGAPVVMSPKIGFCIGDSYRLDPSLVHSPSTLGYDGGTCSDPSAMRGISVGWGDQYDWNDPGQSIDVSTLPDGVYWFRGIVDPNNYLLERDETNNTTDIKLQITGTSVTVMSALSGIGTIAVDASVLKNGSGTLATAPFSTSVPNTLLVAFVASDGNQGQTATVSGGGLTWSLVRRTNTQLGTSEVWAATATSQLTNVVVTATQAFGGADQSLTVMAFRGAAGVGATAGASGATGAPSVSLTATRAGSAVFAVGNDWDKASLRTLGPNQVMVHQWVDTHVGDTFWVQALASATSAAGPVTLNDTLPTTDRWNLAAVEILPGTPPPPDTQPPTVSMTAPTDGATVSGPVTVSADASDDVGVTSVQFLLDGANLGPIKTSAPYSMTWDSTTVANGPHKLGARASDASGKTGTATEVNVTVSNPTTPLVISAVTAGNITTTSAAITWTTSRPASSQVEYGTTASYGSSTTLDTALVTAHSVSLSGLTPGTDYHYHVLSTDVNGVQAVSQDFTLKTVAPPLVGSQALALNTDSNAAGRAEAFQYTATTTGTVTSITVYIDLTNAATTAVVGLYANAANDTPGTLLAKGTITSLASGAWNTVAVPAASVTAGTKYWLALLGPSGSGTIRFRDTASGGGKSKTSNQSNLTTLPANWSTGGSATQSPASIYASGTSQPDTQPPSVTMTAPADGATVSGTVTVSANASDDTGVTSVQFLLDGAALGAAVTAAPYNISWNTTTATNGSHTLSARAADSSGKTATATSITVTVSNVLLVGSSIVQSTVDSNTAGVAEAFQYTASASGNVTKLYVYIDSGSTATTVVVGLYTNSTSDNPGSLLAQATITSPVKGAWNAVAIPTPVSVTAGTKYWLAILGPSGAGTVKFRDVASGGKAQTSSQSNLTTLPATWSPGTNWANSPASFYGAQE